MHNSNKADTINKVVYLDPHKVKRKIDNIEEMYQKKPAKFHCDQARILEMNDLDPSLSFGYLLESYDDYINWITEITNINQTINNQF